VHLILSIVIPSSKRSFCPWRLQLLVIVYNASTKSLFGSIVGVNTVFSSEASTSHVTAVTHNRHIVSIGAERYTGRVDPRVGLDRVRKILGWVGLGHKKVTHVQLCIGVSIINRWSAFENMCLRFSSTLKNVLVTFYGHSSSVCHLSATTATSSTYYGQVMN